MRGIVFISTKEKLYSSNSKQADKSPDEKLNVNHNITPEMLMLSVLRGWNATWISLQAILSCKPEHDSNNHYIIVTGIRKEVINIEKKYI